MLIDKVKVALRTLTDDEGINTEIQDYIDACIDDLKSAHIEVEMVEGDVTDSKIRLAIIQYAKAYFYTENSEKYLANYNSIKAQLGVLND